MARLSNAPAPLLACITFHLYLCMLIHCIYVHLAETAVMWLIMVLLVSVFVKLSTERCHDNAIVYLSSDIPS